MIDPYTHWSCISLSDGRSSLAAMGPSMRCYWWPLAKIATIEALVSMLPSLTLLLRLNWSMNILENAK